MAVQVRQPRERRRRGQVGPPGASIPGDLTTSGEPHPLAHAATWSRWVVVATLLLSGVLTPWPAATAAVTLVVAGVGFAAGVPHGAIDHLAAARLTGGRPVRVVAVVYALLAAAAWALMAWGGPAALAVVAVLSVLHFGAGELEISRQLTGWRPNGVAASAIVLAGCGALVLPLARSGDQLAAVASAVSPDLAPLIAAEPVRVALVVTWLAAALFAVVEALRAGQRAIAFDIVVVGLLGALAPPLVAFAVWFGGWHALRHCARLLTVEPGCAQLIAAGRHRAAVRRFARLAAWPSAAALAFVVALGCFTVASPDPTTLVAELLRLLLALTVPHMAVVWWLDRTTGRRRVRSEQVAR